MKAPAVWFRLIIGDYLRRVAGLTRLQRGALNDLTIHYFSKACLPTDETVLARICEMSRKEWQANRDAIKEAGQFMDDWRADWIEAELKDVSNRREHTAKARATLAERRAAQPPQPRDNHQAKTEQFTAGQSQSQSQQKEKRAANQAVTYPKGSTSTSDLELNGTGEGATREGNGGDPDHGEWWLAYDGETRQ